MADDPVQSVADPIASDPNIIPPPESASDPADRPVPTILADSSPEPATPSADLTTDYTAPATIPADLSTEASAKVDPSVATESATISSSPVPVSADSQVSEKGEKQSATVPTEAQGKGISPPQEAPVPSPDPVEGGSIPVSFPPNEPSQVQPEVPVNAPNPEASQVQEISPQSAEIKPEPPQGTQNAPLADSNSQKSSFGDILVGTGEAKPPVEEPTIYIEPIEPPKPMQPLQTPISPSSPQPQVDKVVEAKADFSSKRQQALQVRRKKREDHLAKIIALVGQKGKVSNKDVRDLLRVSQSTASEHLQTLVNSGKIKKEGKAKATVYSL